MIIKLIIPCPGEPYNYVIHNCIDWLAGAGAGAVISDVRVEHLQEGGRKRGRKIPSVSLSQKSHESKLVNAAKVIQHRESQDHKALFNTLSFHPANDPALICTLQSPISMTVTI